jgi:hypothetical protein
MRPRLAILLGLVLVGSLLALLHDASARRPGATLTGEPAARLLVDRADRRSVIDTFYDIWWRNQLVPVGWTGSVRGCHPGQVSTTAQSATRVQINYFRTLAGLREVGLDTELQGGAQRTALMMDANNQLSHDPPDTWACRTDIGDRLAGRSNLALGSTVPGARAITLYVRDPGSGNTPVGHRRWLLNPRTARMSAGSTSSANAVVVVGMPQHSLPVPRWVPWPSAGYFPAPLEPAGRWSLSTSLRRTDFSRAAVTVRDASGLSLPVRKHPLVDGMGPRTLVWHVGDLRTPAVGADLSYRVRVSGIRHHGERVPAVAWTVTLVRPDRRTRLVEQPTLTGTLAAGQELRVSTGTWAPRARSVRYQWLRDGTPLPSQTYPFYRVQDSDAGHSISVRVRGSAPYHLPGSTVVGGRVSRS